MNFIKIITETFTLSKNLLNELKNKRSLLHLFVLALAVTFTSGFLLFIIDPNIHTLPDGIWSSWVTITHVGFGDVVPTSFFGRLLAAGLILFGLFLFSLFTAAISVGLMSRNLDSWGQNVRQIEQETSLIETEENKILKELGKLHERMDALEKKLIVTGTTESK